MAERKKNQTTAEQAAQKQETDQVARQYTTYQGGIPKQLKKFVRAHPTVRALIIHTGHFATVRKRLETPGTVEAAIYKKVKSEL